MPYSDVEYRRRPKPFLPSAVFFWITMTLPVLLCVAFAWLFIEQRQLQAGVDERRVSLQYAANNLTEGQTQLLSLDDRIQPSDRERIKLLLRYGLEELERAQVLMRNDQPIEVRSMVRILERETFALRTALQHIEQTPDGDWHNDIQLQTALLRVQQQQGLLRELIHREQKRRLDSLQYRLYATIIGALALLAVVVVRLRWSLRAEAATVSDLMAAEAALRESDGRLRALLRAATENVWLADARFERYRFNPPLRIGKRPAQAEWSDPEWVEMVHPDDRAMVRNTVRAGFRRREAIRWEFRVSDGEGGWRWMESRAVPELDAEGKIVQWLGLSLDTTERHTVAEQLHHAHKMEAVGALTGGIAHDFNNMLAVILGNLELLQEQNLTAPQSSMLSSAMRAAERASELTHRLLAFGRRQSLRPTVVDLAGHLPGLLNMLVRTLGSNIEVVPAYDRSPLLVRVDVTQLDNAILNLAINARDAIEGAGRLTLALDRVYGRFVDTFALGNEDAHPDPDRIYAMFAITDTGSGMTPDVLERAFDPFFTTKPVGQGSGLGLSMVHGFVRQSQGFIGAQSSPGEGTTIRIFLPVTTEAPATINAPAAAAPAIPAAISDVAVADVAVPAAPVAASPDTTAGYRILLVDDDDDVRGVLAGMLSALGHVVTETNSGQSTVDLLQGGARFDLMITDIQMPGSRSGVDLAREVVLRHWVGRVIFVSGSEPPADSLKRLSGHDHPFLRKPIRRQDLINAIDAVMAKPEVWL
jgi:PAS domain S-box-containing protein